MFEQKLFNLPCWPDINEHAAKEISQWSDLVEPLDWFPPLLCKIIWLYNRKFVKLLGLFLIRCVFTKKILGGQKFVKTGTGKNRGFPEHCAMVRDRVNWSTKILGPCPLRKVVKEGMACQLPAWWPLLQPSLLPPGSAIPVKEKGNYSNEDVKYDIIVLIIVLHWRKRKWSCEIGYLSWGT